MEHLLGIDIGTSGTKALLIRPDGKVVASVTEEYPLSTPRPGWAEQDPELWWKAVCRAARKLLRLAKAPAAAVAGIGLSGQMHGSVFLGASLKVLRPAILWCDQRTGEACRLITETIGANRLLRKTANPALAGFTLPKILWEREHEPKVWKQVRHVLLPKDYIRLRLTGELATEVSDASGTLLFDVKRRRWSKTMWKAFDLDPGLLPRVVESPEVTGKLSASAAKACGLAAGTPVVGGAGDQAAGAVGSGVVVPGQVSSSIGTSGVLFAPMAEAAVESRGRLHTFCHAVPGLWHAMGCTLSAGGCLRWFRDTLAQEEVKAARKHKVDPYERITDLAASAPPGAEGLVFLPYLMGERVPYADPNARGVFVGLSLRHTKAHMARAILEGVVFALRDTLALMGESGIHAKSIIASGGGARSRLWRQIQADMFEKPVVVNEIDEGPALGVALLAGVGTGLYPDVASACRGVIKAHEQVWPSRSRSRTYDAYYKVYHSLYGKLQATFADLAVLAGKE